MKSNANRSMVRDLHKAWRFGIDCIRWSVILLFTVLYVVGLILRLPWKILILLAIIPAVGFFVPRKQQKWVWAVLTLIAVGVYLWIFFLPETENSGWNTYQYTEEIDPEFLISRQNAAVHYNELFESQGEVVFSYPYSFMEDQMTYIGPWKADQYPAFSRWLDQRQPVLETLVEITGMPLCRFEAPIDLRRHDRQQLRLKLMRAWTDILIRSANRDLGEGELEAALEKQLAVLGMARHLYAQGNLLDQATAFNLERRTARLLHAVVIDFPVTKSMLERIDSHTQQTLSNWPENWTFILQREKRLAKNYAGMFYQVNEQGQTRISRDLGQGIHVALGHPAYRFLRSRELSRLLVLSMWLSIPSSPQGVEEMIEKRFDRYARMAEEGKDLEYIDTWPVWMRGLNYRSVIDWYAKQQVAFYYPLKNKDLSHQALKKVTQILIELKRYRQREGTWPQRLDDLLGGDFTGGRLFDPVSGLVFVYESTADGFQLYSLGANHRDDGGLNNGQDKDDRMYWPQPAAEDFLEEIPVIRADTE